ncbi:flagellar motor switch phosphatase FliY [Desulfuribacillus alkaliarsenatis]|uniref:Flagellar motor switch phosphatase FliY n=1 Tax=Desulfuribacillus alkaliarsenatis TaxID=766136 RepID=A0A1E5G5Y5_9FIRM|nr:flagellar motor switch phosphatase FliY [Desulfuribacillus alkaliarsenatis]OEF98617.1 flagellar motor switch phosphatase FliY [Desulfuribacillus alkaliarsenatis]
MGRDMLSQEEIDALLKAGGSDEDDDESTYEALDTDSSKNTNVSIDINDYLSPFEQDALGEIGNISFGSAATALSTLLGQKVDITTPTVSVIEVEKVNNEFPMPHVAVNVGYTSGFEGSNLLVIKSSDARIIADLMMGGDGRPDQEQELSELHTSAVSEAMNQMMGSAATAMSTIFNDFVNISPPETKVLDFDDTDSMEMLPDEDVLIKISFRLIVGDLIDSYIMQLVPVNFAKDMVNRLTGGMSEESQAPEQPAAAATTQQAPPHAVEEKVAASPNQGNQQHQEQHMPQYPNQGYPAYQEQPQQQQQQGAPYNYGPPPGYPPQGYGQPQYMYPPPPPSPQKPEYYGGLHQPNVQPAEFSSFDQSKSSYAGEGNLNLLLDVPLQVTVELGRTRRQIKDILELSQGSIIELDRLAGEPVDILVNNKLIAKGEVVVIDENFGVRVTDIISQIERVQKLQ